MEVHATEIRTRIEAAYGNSLAELKQQVEDEAQVAGVLGAVLTVYADLTFAEYSVEFQRERLRQLVDPERHVGDFDVSHMSDCIQRLSQAHSARKAHTAAITALLDATRPASAASAGTAPPSPTPRHNRSL